MSRAPRVRGGLAAFGLCLVTAVTASCSGSGTATSLRADSGPVPPEGGIVLAPDGLGVVSFGADMDEAVAAVTAALGAEPSDDTGWIDPFAEFGTCPGTEVRGVSWGDLRLIFGDADTRLVPLGERHFYGFTYRTGRRGPDGLTTAEGIGLGSSRAELEAAYGDELELFLDDTITGGPRYQIGFEIDSSTYLSGILSSEDGVVVWLDGGVGCAPIA